MLVIHLKCTLKFYWCSYIILFLQHPKFQNNLDDMIGEFCDKSLLADDMFSPPVIDLPVWKSMIPNVIFISLVPGMFHFLSERIYFNCRLLHEIILKRVLLSRYFTPIKKINWRIKWNFEQETYWNLIVNIKLIIPNFVLIIYRCINVIEIYCILSGKDKQCITAVKWLSNHDS